MSRAGQFESDVGLSTSTIGLLWCYSELAFEIDGYGDTLVQLASLRNAAVLALRDGASGRITPFPIPGYRWKNRKGTGSLPIPDSRNKNQEQHDSSSGDLALDQHWPCWFPVSHVKGEIRE